MWPQKGSASEEFSSRFLRLFFFLVFFFCWLGFTAIWFKIIFFVAFVVWVRWFLVVWLSVNCQMGRVVSGELDGSRGGDFFEFFVLNLKTV